MTRNHPKPTASKEDTGKASPVRVLLVDDETGLLKVTKKILEMKEKFHVDTALSVNEAYQKMKEKKFNVIVSDYLMPIKDGLTFLEELRENENSIPFILFTGKGREDVIIKALNLGANRYINKIGKPEAVYCELAYAIVEVVEKHRSEQMLVESEEKYRVLIERAADGVAIIQGNSFKFLNKRFAEMLGYEQEELMNTEFASVIPPENRERLLDGYEKQQAGEDVPSTYETPILKKNGEKIHAELNLAIIQYGAKPAIMAVIRDITKRRKNEEILEKSEEKYRNIVELMPDGIATFTNNGTVTSVNKAFLDLTGFSEDEIVGKHFTQLPTLRARDMPKHIKLFSRLIRGKLPTTFEFVYHRKDGVSRWGEAHFSLINKDGKNVGFQAVLIDITERKKLTDELSNESAFMQTLLEQHPDFVYFKDNSARFQLVCDRFCKFLKLDKKEIIGKTDLEIFSKKTANESYKEDLEVIKTGKAVINKEEAVNEMVLLTTKLPWFSKKGEIVGLFGISRDITKIKKVENYSKKILDKMTLNNEKLGVIGKFTRHDVLNKLSSIVGNIYLMKQILSSDSECLEYVNEIESSVDQIERILNFAKNYEMLGVEELSLIDVGGSFDATVSLFPVLDNVEVVNDCGGLKVIADSLLNTLFYNLVDNSIKYGGKISRIRICCKEGKDELLLVYEDDGVGISENEKEAIFREGYGKGTGLGLFLIEKLCNVYGWTIKETGEQNKGVQFTITIPNTYCMRVKK